MKMWMELRKKNLTTGSVSTIATYDIYSIAEEAKNRCNDEDTSGQYFYFLDGPHWLKEWVPYDESANLARRGQQIYRGVRGLLYHN